MPPVVGRAIKRTLFPNEMPDSPVTFTPAGAVTIARILERLENPTSILKQIGALGVSASQLAFRQQRLGNIPWPERYPNQKGKKINLAGALMDWNAGGKVKARRFKDRPALSDTRDGFRSIKDRIVSQDTVEWGSNLEYMARQHAGKASSQKVTEGAKERIARFVKTKRGKPFEGILKALLKKDSLRTQPNKRPIVGITDELSAEITAEVNKGFIDG